VSPRGSPQGDTSGESLLEVLEKRGTLPEAQVLAWAVDVCEVLEGLHGRTPPELHGAIRPDTLHLAEGGAVHLAERSGADRPESSGYIPREQREGRAEPRSDIFSLGATMHHLLSGEPPERAPFPPLCRFRKDISLETQAALDKALKERPEERFPDVTAFKDSLRGILRPEGDSATGAVRGTVRCRKKGTAISDALVTLGGYSARTGPGGDFFLASVPPGARKLEIFRAGYAPFVQELIVPGGGGEATIDAKLEPAGLGSSAPPGALARSAVFLIVTLLLVGIVVFGGLQRTGKEIRVQMVEESRAPVTEHSARGIDPARQRAAIENYSDCQSTVGKICTAVSAFQKARGRLPRTLGELVSGRFLKEMPRCPIAKKDTYSSSYRWTASPSAGYSFFCKGSYHADAGVRENRPSVRFP